VPIVDATFSPLRLANPNAPAAPRILVPIATPDQASTDGLPRFARLYRLTPAETRVLQYLLEQRNTQEIAETLTIGIKTLRTHLSNLFAKTGTATQRELVRFFPAHPAVGQDGEFPCPISTGANSPWPREKG
jgi:DNA-binding CsgD family transcriptional regulator